MNMDYVRLIMEKWQDTESLTLTKDTLLVEVVDDQEPNSLCYHLDDLWCSKSPEGSVGFVDFIQTFGAVEPNPFGRGDEGEPTVCLYDQLDSDQQVLFGRIDMEIDELDGKLSYQKTREVLLAQIQSIDDHELYFS